MTSREVLDELKKGDIDRKDIQKIYKENVLKYLNEGYVLNQKSETEYTEIVAKVIENYEEKATILPFTCYRFLSNETSSKGYYSYLNFLDYITKIRNKFVEFYVQNRYNEYGKNSV